VLGEADERPRRAFENDCAPPWPRPSRPGECILAMAAVGNLPRRLEQYRDDDFEGSPTSAGAAFLRRVGVRRP